MKRKFAAVWMAVIMLLVATTSMAVAQDEESVAVTLTAQAPLVLTLDEAQEGANGGATVLTVTVDIESLLVVSGLEILSNTMRATAALPDSAPGAATVGDPVNLETIVRMVEPSLLPLASHSTEDNVADAEIHYKQGLAYVEEGELQKAIGEFDQAIELDPGNALAYIDRGAATANLGDLGDGAGGLQQSPGPGSRKRRCLRRSRWPLCNDGGT